MKYSGGRKAATKRFHDKQYARLKALEAINPLDPEVVKSKADQKERSRKWISKNPEKVRAKSRNWRKNNPDKVKKQKRTALNKKRAFIRSEKDKPCFDCGIKYPYYAMHFDHLRDKNFGVNGSNGTKSYQKIKDEITKCQVECANCHSIRTFKRMNGTEVSTEISKPNWMNRSNEIALLMAA